jgi:L-ascorbate metabolism protein UlaG (beta-lactamase superfamily)
MLTCRDIRVDTRAGGGRGLLAAGPQSAAAGAVDITWLGQAGFLVRAAGNAILIDPYLSDSLATKYRGREFAHERLMAPPIVLDEIGGAYLCRLDFVLCTHRHSDHMDPETLAAVTLQQPGCRFVVPAAELNHALSLGLPEGRVLPIDAGDTLSLGDGVVVKAIPAAHESFQQDAAGRHRFLGYVITIGGLTLYHSGDTVVYPGLAATLANEEIDCALLPVNGRDAYRASRGVPGNMTAGEAIDLCNAAGIPLLVPHHFGMFAFNTASHADLELLRHCSVPRVVIPDLDTSLRLHAPPSPTEAKP